MANSDIIPQSDGDFDDFQSNVVEQLTENAAAWEIPTKVLTDLTALQTPWKTAYAVVSKDGQFTQSDTAAKNAARKAYEAELRDVLQQWVQKNKKVTDTNRSAMGIKPLDGQKTKTPVPTDVPLVKTVPLESHSLKVEVRNSKGTLAKPDGVNRINIRYKLGGEAPLNSDEATQMKGYTKQPIVLSFTEDQAGQKVYIYAQYENSLAEGGPWSPKSIVASVP